MSWVDVRVDTIMRDSNNSMGGKTYGLAHYLQKIVEQNDKIIKLLGEKQCSNT